MPLVLMALTKVGGERVTVNPSLIEVIETTDKGTRVVLTSGKELLVTDVQERILKIVNTHPVDGF